MPASDGGDDPRRLRRRRSELACQCDLRIAGHSARFGVPINRLGFAIAYDELAALLPLVGRAVALEILVEGRVWGAEEAQAKGC